MNPNWWSRIKAEAKEELSGIIPVEGGIAIKSKYNKEFTQAIKGLPKECRSWNDTPNNRFWFVAESHAEEATVIYNEFFGEPETGGFPVSLAEISQDDPAVRSSIQAEMQYRPIYCPDCGREMEQDDGGYPYCEYCEG